MKILQKALDTAIENLPEELVADLLDKKLAEHGVRLTRRQCEAMARRVIKDKIDTFELPWWRFWQYSPFRAPKDLLVSFTAEDGEKILAILKELSERAIPEMTQRLIDEEPDRFLAALKRDWKGALRRRRRGESGFRRRLLKRWGKPLVQLKMLIAIAEEFGDEVNRKLRNEDIGDRAHLIDVLTRLHARSCQIASEVECLLCGGFSDGAMARWRSLHEVAVVAQFIVKHGPECAERYTYHQFVEAKKATNNYVRCQQRLGYEPMPEDELAGIDRDYRFVLGKYGKDFRRQYGWAHAYLNGTSRATFSDIEKAVGVDHLRGHYQMASHSVHANPRGVFFKLGLMGDSEVLLAGASNAGLTDPGHCTALSLVQASSTLMLLSTNLDSIVIMKLMTRLAEEIGDNFLSASEQLERDDEKYRAQAA